MKEKLILTDCDGVLLHWEWSFDRWMQKHGYKKLYEGNYSTAANYGISDGEADKLVRMFNESVYISSLPPFKDAIKHIKFLHEEYGYIFHVITSVGGSYEVANARKHNLRNVFGTSPFYKIECLDPSISKKEALLPYTDSGCFWIEDHPVNAKIGVDLGLNTIMVNQDYNKSAFDCCNNRVDNWLQITNIILNKENQ